MKKKYCYEQNKYLLDCIDKTLKFLENISPCKIFTCSIIQYQHHVNTFFYNFHMNAQIATHLQSAVVEDPEVVTCESLIRK